MSNLAGDLRSALRTLASRPAFTLMVTGILAVGIAGNLAMFTIYSGVFLRPLPLQQPDRVVDLDETAPRWNLRFVSIAKPDFDAWREHNSTFDGMAAFDTETFNLSGKGAAQRLMAARITGDMLKVLRLTPELGRGFLKEEAGQSLVLLGHRVWREKFGGGRNVIGQMLKLDGEAYTVVGVLPARAELPTPVDIWVPLAADPPDRHGWYLNGIGRLKPGVTIEQARADLTRIHRGLIETGRKDNEVTSPTVLPLKERYVGDFRRAGNVLLGAVAIVLLIACANIAGLLMVRGAARSREMAVRAALGASRARLARQLATESLVYAAAGGFLGVLLGRLLLRFLLASVPDSPLPWLDFQIDYRAAAFAVGITGIAAILFGLAPAIQGSRTDVRSSIEQAARSSASGKQRLVMNGLVAGEIGLALLLLIAASLLFQTLRHITRVDPGFRPQGVLTYTVALPQASYPETADVVNFFQKLVERMRSLPGVSAAAAASLPPLAGHSGMFFVAEGMPPVSSGRENPAVLQVFATPGYLETLGIPLLAGRHFTERDGEAGRRVAIVNESFAKRFFPNTDPVGRRIRYAWRKDEWIEVAGVARDVRHYGLDQDVRPGVFIPYRQWVVPVMTIVLRTAGDAGAMVGPAREALRQIDPELPMFDVTRMTDAVDRSLWTRRLYASLAVAFAAVAVLLAIGGVYGVTSYAVTQRRREMGIRAALGATPARITLHVLRHGLAMLVIGVPAGVTAMLALSGLLQNLLFGVTASDPVVYTAAVLAVAGVALAANLLPARRAAGIAPVEALRSE